MRCSGVVWRARRTATVAATSESKTKKWVTPNGLFSIEVAELIVESRPEVGIFRRCGAVLDGGGGLLALRPANRDETENERARDSHRVRQEPRDSVEALVDRG